jgi:hypothetical protein
VKKLFYPLCFVAFVALVILGSCTHYIYISRSGWQEKTVVADGKPLEWKIPLRYYDESSKLQYTVTNDFHNMYFLIRVADQQAQTKMLKAGLQLWIDTTGQNEHHIGIMFPLSSAVRKAEEEEPVLVNADKRDSKSEKIKFRSGYKEMELIGFKSPIVGINPINSKYGITASINWDSLDVMTYEAIVPFRTFYKDSITPKDSLKLMGVSIVLNAIPLMKTEGEHEGRAGRLQGAGGGVPGSGSGMPQGGGHGGGRGGDARQGRAPTFGPSYLNETNVIKKTFQLSGLGLPPK